MAEKTVAAEAVSEKHPGLPFTLPERAPVTRLRHVDARALLHPAGGRTQALAGFDDEFTDIVDYIYRITHRIWVDRALGMIYDYYDHVSTIYTPYGVTRTVEEVVAATAAMINAYPDRESHFLNVAWSGDDVAGFYTSHLGFSRMTNRGPTIYGPATQKQVVIRTVADCISLNNQIHTEWLVRDNGAMVRQLGFDRHEVARRLAERGPPDTPTVSPTPRMLGQQPPQQLDIPGDTPEGFMRHFFHDVWNRRRLDRLSEVYAPSAVAHSGGGRMAVGVRNIGALIIAMLTAIPDAVVRVEHVSWSEETDGVIVAVRWQLEGSTQAGGLLGDCPRGAPVAMIAMSHFRFGGGADAGRIVEEWTLFDEIGVLVQAYRATGPTRI